MGASILLDDDVLVTDALASGIGDSAATALDPQTGKTRWRRDTGTPWGLNERLLAARGGRVFVREDGAERRFCVLDAWTGAELWSHTEREPWHTFSETGALVTDIENPGIVTVRDARDGSTIATLSPRSSPLALTDDGTAYATGGTYLRPQLVALRIADASELWRADTANPNHLLRLGDCLYCGRLTQTKQHAEVTALDARTSRRAHR